MGTNETVEMFDTNETVEEMKGLEAAMPEERIAYWPTCSTRR